MVDAQIHTGIVSDVLDLPRAIENLRKTPPPARGVLSAYIDTSVERVKGRAYLLAFRAGWKALQETLEFADPAERKAFEAAVAQADDFLLHRFVARYPGIAIFASGEPDYFFAVPMPNRPWPEFAWSPQPHIGQLVEALDEFERVAVALVDKSTTRLFTIYLGAIHAHESFETELPGRGGAADYPFRVRSSPPRQDINVPGSMPTGAWSGMVQGRLERRHLERAMQHLRRTSRALMDLLRREPFDRLFLAGPEEARTLLAQDLPRPLRARLAGQFSLPMTASEAEIHQATIDAMEAIEREREREYVTQLLEQASTPNVALGLDAVLEAASMGALHHLFISERFKAEGSECEQCGRLVVGFDRCPSCGAPPTQSVDLRERLFVRGLEEGARIEVVKGQAAEMLDQHGGVGAFVRF